MDHLLTTGGDFARKHHPRGSAPCGARRGEETLALLRVKEDALGFDGTVEVCWAIQEGCVRQAVGSRGEAQGWRWQPVMLPRERALSCRVRGQLLPWGRLASAPSS